MAPSGNVDSPTTNPHDIDCSLFLSKEHPVIFAQVTFEENDFEPRIFDVDEDAAVEGATLDASFCS